MEKRKLVSNSLAMLINRLVQSIVTFILSAAIARMLGTESLGRYLLAFSFYFMFVSIVSQGLKTLFTRELSRDPTQTATYLVSGSLLQFGFSLVGYVALVIVVTLLPYSDSTTTTCYIMGLTVLPFALSNITEAIFQAQERMHLIAIATVPIYITRLGVMIWAMGHGFGVDDVAKIFVASEALILIIQWILIIPIVRPQWRVDSQFMWRTLVEARTFFAIEGVAVINDRIQILVLSLLGNESLVGLYGGIIQLIQPFLIIANSVVLGIFPGMAKAIQLGRQKQRWLAESVIEMLLCISGPFLIGLYFVGGDLLRLIYGNAGFEVAVPALRLVALTLLLAPFTRALSYLLVANGLERTNLIEVAVTTVIGGLSGVYLVSHYQLVGAAAMDLVMHTSAFMFYFGTVYRKLFVMRVAKVFYRPLLISGLMTLVFLGLQRISYALPITLSVAVTAYCVFAGAIAVAMFGGPQMVWMKLTARK
jgi:O-antigen/teichoic acid export membrane protein